MTNEYSNIDLACPIPVSLLCSLITIYYKCIFYFFAIHSCTLRYVGEFCEYTNPCLTAPRCQNGGTCQVVIRDGQSTFECKCPMGFSASLCEISENTACSSSPCQHNGECVLKSLEEFTCRCQEGFSGLCEFFLSNFVSYQHE